MGGRKIGLFGRDLGNHQHDSTFRTFATRPEIGPSRAAWALEDDHVCGGFLTRRTNRTNGCRWCDERRSLGSVRASTIGSHATPGRHRHHGRSIQPQACVGAARDRISRYNVTFSAAIVRSADVMDPVSLIKALHSLISLSAGGEETGAFDDDRARVRADPIGRRRAPSCISRAS